MSNQPISSSLSSLRDAANQIAREDRAHGNEAMLFAADQIARERGLESPLKGSVSQSRERFSDDEFSPRAGSSKLAILKPALSPRGRNEINVVATDAEKMEGIHDDVEALFREMKVKPKPQTAAVDLVDDVNELLMQHARKQKSERNRNDQPARPSSKLAQSMYLRKTKELDRRNQLHQTDNNRIDKRYKQQLELSRISTILNEFDEKEIGEKVRQSFAHEMVLRSMKVSHLAPPRPMSARERKLEEDMGEGGRGGGLGRRRHDASKATSASSSRGDNKHRESRVSELDYDALRKSTERLSRPSSAGLISHHGSQQHRDPLQRYATFDDAKECTFRPQIGKRNKASKKGGNNNSDDEGKKEDPKYSFINRQEAEERMRRQELQFNIGEIEYNARIDKKKCPQCGSTQKYDEVKEKRKLCPLCKVEYCYPNSWGKVSKRFFKKGHEFAQRVAKNQLAIREEVTREIKEVEFRRVDKETGKVVTIVQQGVPTRPKMTEEQIVEFYSRMHEGEYKKKENLEKIDKSVYSEFTFRPSVKKLSKKFVDDDGNEVSDEDSDGSSNVVEKFLMRVDDDIEYRREKMPERYKPRRKYKTEEEEDDDSYSGFR